MAGERTDITEIERAIISKLAGATYPPATAAKRFVRDLNSGYIKQLSEKGRAFLAFIAHRFRRQYRLSNEEWSWIREHKKENDNVNSSTNSTEVLPGS